FPTSSTVNVDTLPKVNGVANFSTMSIPAGTTVTLTGNTAAKFRFTGNVSISGVLRSNGGVGQNGQYASSGFAAISGGTAGAGGTVGGVPNNGFTSTLADAPAASGTGGGKGGRVATGNSVKYVYSWGGYGYNYFYGGSGGGGGSNLLHFPGRPGGKLTWAAGYYGTKDGGAAGSGATDPGAMTMSNLTGGFGGGAGANGGYNYWSYSGSMSWNYNYGYGGGAGGGGGGGVGIETAGTFTMGSSSRIEMLGGTGGYGYTSYTGGGGAGGSGGGVLIRANSISYSTGAVIDTTGGLGTKSYNSVNYDYGNNGGNGGLGAIRLESVSAFSMLNTGGILGYSASASTGSLTTATYKTGDLGVTTWQTAAGLAPDFHTGTLAAQGNLEVNLEGAMADPVTGLQSTTFTGTQNIAATPLTQGLATPNPIDGYKFWRVVFKLKPPVAPLYQLPEVYDASLKIDTK
ncbi:MAG: hypothetical protein HUU06_09590, partial [Planctomycetaceae bacterium]|nr:hypothetical protein [Planctomycetaceae bacterium]